MLNVATNNQQIYISETDGFETISIAVLKSEQEAFAEVLANAISFEFDYNSNEKGVAKVWRLNNLRIKRWKSGNLGLSQRRLDGTWHNICVFQEDTETFGCQVIEAIEQIRFAKA